MRGFKIGLALAGIAALAAGCSDGTKVITADLPPLAFVRFVNAVPDTGGQDWRFVDAVENSPTTFNMKFRGVFPGATYQGAAAGSRHLTVFQAPVDLANPALSSPAFVSTVFFDTTFTFVAGSHYTIIATGNIRPGGVPKKLIILTDDFTDPAANVAVRVVNLNVASAVDVYGSATGGTSALPASPLAAGLAQGTASKWTTMAPGALSLRAFTTGTAVFPALVDVAAPPGVAADRVNNLTAIGGSTIAGSVFTAFIFPRSVAGSIASSFTTPGIVYAVDKYPPSGF
jgi:hypothetical protein